MSYEQLEIIFWWLVHAMGVIILLLIVVFGFRKETPATEISQYSPSKRRVYIRRVN